MMTEHQAEQNGYAVEWPNARHPAAGALLDEGRCPRSYASWLIFPAAQVALFAIAHNDCGSDRGKARFA
jgi:hypothetical protein